MLNIIKTYGASQVDASSLWTILNQSGIIIDEKFDTWIEKHIESGCLYAGIDYIKIEKKYLISVTAIPVLLTVLQIAYANKKEYFIDDFIKVKSFIQSEYEKASECVQEINKNISTLVDHQRAEQTGNLRYEKIFLDYIKSAPERSKSEITKRYQRVGKDVRDKILSKLEEENVISSERLDVPNTHRKKIIYRAVA